MRMFWFRGSLAAAISIAVACGLGLSSVGLSSVGLAAEEYKSGKRYPEPQVIDPGPPGGPPSDAIVLFDGADLSAWKNGYKWIVADGVAVAHETSIDTKQTFGDCQLHIEYCEPELVHGAGQGRGNSGVKMMQRYEIQILDSYQNKTYFDGQAGAIYKQHPPLVNACRKPGEWQTFDIVFETPLFDEKGKPQKSGYVTVLHNGVAVQSHAQIEGTTSYTEAGGYVPHPPKQPILLQYHGHPVRFRNIWVREM